MQRIAGGVGNPVYGEQRDEHAELFSVQLRQRLHSDRSGIGKDQRGNELPAHEAVLKAVQRVIKKRQRDHRRHGEQICLQLPALRKQQHRDQQTRHDKEHRDKFRRQHIEAAVQPRNLRHQQRERVRTDRADAADAVSEQIERREQHGGGEQDAAEQNRQTAEKCRKQIPEKVLPLTEQHADQRKHRKERQRVDQHREARQAEPEHIEGKQLPARPVNDAVNSDHHQRKGDHHVHELRIADEIRGEADTVEVSKRHEPVPRGAVSEMPAELQKGKSRKIAEQKDRRRQERRKPGFRHQHAEDEVRKQSEVICKRGQVVGAESEIEVHHRKLRLPAADAPADGQQAPPEIDQRRVIHGSAVSAEDIARPQDRRQIDQYKKDQIECREDQHLAPDAAGRGCGLLRPAAPFSE